MANIPISGVSTVAETLENEDLILVSKKNEEKYTSAKMSGEKLKKSLVDSLFDVIYPVGSIYISINSTLPDNFSGTWERIAEGKCLWGSDSTGSNSGTVVEAGLPDINGTLGLNIIGVSSADYVNKNYMQDSFSCTSIDTAGKYYLHRWATASDSDSKCVCTMYVSFDASKSNVIYGNSDTVQPPALVVSMWKRTA